MKTNRYVILTFLAFLFANGVEAQLKVGGKQILSLTSKTDRITFPQTAVNTKTGENLVVWGRFFPSEIFGRIVTAQGTLKGQLSLVKASTFPTDDAFIMSAAYNPLTDEYLLAYDGFDDQNPSIFVLRLNTKGVPIGAAMNVTKQTELNRNINPQLLFNPVTGGYILFWFSHGLPEVPNDALYVVMLLDKNGKPNGPFKSFGNPIDATTKIGTVIDFKFTPSGKKLFLVTNKAVGSANGYFLVVVDPLLKKPIVYQKLNDTVVPFMRIWTPGAGLAFLPIDTGYAYYTDQTGVRARKMNEQGKLIGKSFPVFTGPAQNKPLYAPTAAFAMTDQGVRGVVLGIDEDEELSGGAITWGQILDESGKPIGSPVKVYNATPSQTLRTGLLTMNPTLSSPSSVKLRWYGALANTPLIAPGPIANQIVRVNLVFRP